MHSNLSSRVPRADRLNLIRDITHLLKKYPSITNIQLLDLVIKEIKLPIVSEWKQDSLHEYILFLDIMNLVKIEEDKINLTSIGLDLVQISSFLDPELNYEEIIFFRKVISKLNKYKDVQKLCFRKYDDNPLRSQIINCYKNIYKQKDDREIRTLLYWYNQLKIYDYNELNNRYFKIRSLSISTELFYKKLREKYVVKSNNQFKMLQIPNLRYDMCLELGIPLDLFNKKLLELFNIYPTVIELGKGSIRRKEVQDFGVFDGQYYYYYIRIKEDISMENSIDFNLRKRIGESKTEINPFAKLSLLKNPFPKSAIADPSSTTTFYSRSRKAQLEEIRDFIINAYEYGRWSSLVIDGEYGSGKSHTLFYIRDEINAQLGTLQDERALAYYIENPKNNINELYNEFLKQVGLDLLSEYTIKCLESDIFQIISKYESKLFKLEIDESIDSVYQIREKSKYIPGPSKKQFYDELSNIMLKKYKTVHKDFIKSLIILALSNNVEETRISWNYISGEKLNKKEANDLDLFTQQISEDEIIKYVFPTILSILNDNDIKMNFILIDELEKITAKSRDKAQTYLENLRSLIDNNQTHLSIIFGSVSESFDIIKSMSPGLSDRLSKSITLASLNNTEATLLIEDYLKKGRPPAYTENSLKPFTERSIFEINRISRGTVRYILENSFVIIDRIAYEHGSKVVDESYVNKIFRG